MKDGGWTFISHSHKDIDKVRLIRNELEKRGFEPLIFYLKCLSDNDEIEDLIKREINERTWFIYVESENSKNSKWVQTERDYIKSLKDKKVFTIDISKDINEQLSQIELITRQMKVFISYSSKDLMIYNKIKSRLLQKDMLILSDLDSISVNWVSAMNNAIIESSRDGFVLLILSKNSIKSKWVEYEIREVMDNNGKLIIINVGGVDFKESNLYYSLKCYRIINVSEDITESELDEIINVIMRNVMFISC